MEVGVAVGNTCGVSVGVVVGFAVGVGLAVGEVVGSGDRCVADVRKFPQTDCNKDNNAFKDALVQS
ncbi:MAG: hypothetical protein F6K28_08060 [Microcoleus sp. SIO2G3]|nr:hypothetical protein [Microcoleus sp. SIO2G3]